MKITVERRDFDKAQKAVGLGFEKVDVLCGCIVAQALKRQGWTKPVVGFDTASVKRFGRMYDATCVNTDLRDMHQYTRVPSVHWDPEKMQFPTTLEFKLRRF